jgi:MFS family permease
MNLSGAQPSSGFAVGWRQVGVCFLLLAAAGMIASTYSLVAVPLAREFRLGRGEVMTTMTVLSATCAVLTPLLGNLMDRVSVRRLMVAGGLCLGAGYAAISLATSFMQVLVIFAVLIAPANVLLGPVAATVLLSRWFAARRGRAMGIAIAGVAAGGMVFPIIIQALLDANQWRQALQLLGLVLVAWTVPAALLAVDRPADRGLHPDGAAEPPAIAREETDKAPVTVGELLSDPAFWMIAFTVAIVTSGMKGMITNLTPLAIDNGITATDAATLISIYAACGFIAKMVFAALSDRLGARVLMFAALGGFAAGMALLTLAAGGYGAIALGVGVIGLFGGMMVPIEAFLAPRIFGQRAVGKAMGLLSGVILVALLTTPPLFGYIFDVTGSYKGIFWTFCGLAAAALLWVPFMRLKPREDAARVLPVPAE